MHQAPFVIASEAKQSILSLWLWIASLALAMTATTQNPNPSCFAAGRNLPLIAGHPRDAAYLAAFRQGFQLAFARPSFNPLILFVNLLSTNLD
jgi:hypothetical protein